MNHLMRMKKCIFAIMDLSPYFIVLIVQRNIGIIFGKYILEARLWFNERNTMPSLSPTPHFSTLKKERNRAEMLACRARTTAAELEEEERDRCDSVEYFRDQGVRTIKDRRFLE